MSPAYSLGAARCLGAQRAGLSRPTHPFINGLLLAPPRSIRASRAPHFRVEVGGAGGEGFQGEHTCLGRVLDPQSPLCNQVLTEPELPEGSSGGYPQRAVERQRRTVIDLGPGSASDPSSLSLHLCISRPRLFKDSDGRRGVNCDLGQAQAQTFGHQ